MSILLGTWALSLRLCTRGIPISYAIDREHCKGISCLFGGFFNFIASHPEKFYIMKKSTLRPKIIVSHVCII